MDVTVTHSGICDVSFYENAISILGVFVAVLGVIVTVVITWQIYNAINIKKEVEAKITSRLDLADKEISKTLNNQRISLDADLLVVNGNLYLSKDDFDEAIIVYIKAMLKFVEIKAQDNVELLMFSCLDIIELHNDELRNSPIIRSNIDALIEDVSPLRSDIGAELYNFFKLVKSDL